VPQNPTASTIHFNLADGTIVTTDDAVRVSSVNSQITIEVRSIHGLAHAHRIARFLQNSYAYATYLSETVIELLEQTKRADARTLAAEDALKNTAPRCCKAA
jgi:hypothetical protein